MMKIRDDNAEREKALWPLVLCQILLVVALAVFFITKWVTMYWAFVWHFTYSLFREYFPHIYQLSR